MVVADSMAMIVAPSVIVLADLCTLLAQKYRSVLQRTLNVRKRPDLAGCLQQALEVSIRDVRIGVVRTELGEPACPCGFDLLDLQGGFQGQGDQWVGGGSSGHGCTVLSIARARIAG